jgi:hypothetical protein
MAADKQLAHRLLDQLDGGQLGAVVHLMQVMTGPAGRAIAMAPFEDEEISAGEEAAAARSKAWLKDNPPIPFEQVAAECGFTMDEIRALAQRPEEPAPSKP